MRNPQGFTLIEIVIVLAVMSILLTLAIPSTHNKIIRGQVKVSLMLVAKYQHDIASYYQATGAFPADNNAIGMPEANKIMGNYLSQVEVINGALQLTLGNKAHKLAIDKVVSLRPIYVVGSPSSPTSWVCAYDAVPNGMQASGDNLSNLDVASLPLVCR
ncbi:MAG: type IV pilus assembly protein PilA [Pseudohongiellaceae bacterium]|jgi:type IV pilus assembly protein PilA